MARLLADGNIPGRVIEALRAHVQAGKFTVVEEERVRMVPLP